jgi:hypothetical protein
LNKDLVAIKGLSVLNSLEINVLFLGCWGIVYKLDNGSGMSRKT